MKSVPLDVNVLVEFLKKSFSSQLKKPRVFNFTFFDNVKIAFNDINSVLLKLVLSDLKFGVKAFRFSKE